MQRIRPLLAFVVAAVATRIVSSIGSFDPAWTDISSTNAPVAIISFKAAPRQQPAAQSDGDIEDGLPEFLEAGLFRILTWVPPCILHILVESLFGRYERRQRAAKGVVAS